MPVVEDDSLVRLGYYITFQSDIINVSREIG